MAGASSANKPGFALLGAGIFARTQYVPRLRELSHLISLRVIWSKSQESALKGGLLVKDFAPDIQVKWGDQGLEDILHDKEIHAITLVLPAQVQLEIVSKALLAGKHVLQEKPVGPNVAEIQKSFSKYLSLQLAGAQSPIWAVAENYRFEPTLLKAASLVKEVGDFVAVQVNIEGALDSSNPYFSSAWRRDFEGGFILDGGVHFVAGLRLMTGCEVTSVAAFASHVDSDLPPPDTLSALFKLDNGCAGTMIVTFCSTTKRVSWRVIGTKGTVHVERGVMEDGNQGYTAHFLPVNGKVEISSSVFSGVYEELKAFAEDVGEVVFMGKDASAADIRSSVPEAFADVAVIEAMLNSSAANGNLVRVAAINKNFV